MHHGVVAPCRRYATEGHLVQHHHGLLLAVDINRSSVGRLEQRYLAHALRTHTLEVSSLALLLVEIVVDVDPIRLDDCLDRDLATSRFLDLRQLPHLFRRSVSIRRCDHRREVDCPLLLLLHGLVQSFYSHDGRLINSLCGKSHLVSFGRAGHRVQFLHFPSWRLNRGLSLNLESGFEG